MEGSDHRPPLRSDTKRGLLVFALCLTTSGVFTLLLLGNRNDDAFITYRHAQNLLAGHGFVFNPGERILGTTAPLHGLLVAASGLISHELPLNALLLSWLAAAALGTLVWRVLADLGRAPAGLVAAALVVCARFTYEVFPLETVLLAALTWAAMWAFMRDRFAWVALFGSAAILVRADAAIAIAAVFAVDLFVRKNPTKLLATGAAIAGMTAPWFLFAWSYYGAPLSNTAATKTGWPGHEWAFVARLWERGVGPLFAADSLAIAASLVALYGLVIVARDPRYRLLRVLPVWLGLYLIAYTAMRIFWAHHWYYYPVFVGTAVLFAVGALALYERLLARLSVDARPNRVKWLSLTLLATCLFINVVGILQFRKELPTAFFVGGRDQLYQEAARWLRQNTEPGARVAVAEPGTLAYYSDRTMIDMMGLVTDGVGDHMKLNDTRVASIGWITEQFDPQIVLLTWPKQRPFSATLPEQPEYRLRDVLGIDRVDVLVLLYAR